MSTLRELITTGPVLADGAMGTMLHADGIAFDRCFDELNLTHPDRVAAVHQAYLAAGARLIFTNTFGANRYKLAAHGLAHRLGEINATAVAIAKRAIADATTDALVAGDVGPLGVRLAPFGRVNPTVAFEAFGEQIAALVGAGVDAIVLETFSDLRELAEAIRAAKSVTAQPVIASMTFTRDDCTVLGEPPAAVAAELNALAADVIGINCSGGPAQVMRILAAMRQAAPRAAFMAKPNAGWPEQVGGRVMYPATPAYFAEYARAFADANVAIIGGCCGTTVAHIAAMRDGLLGRAHHPAAAHRTTPVTARQHDLSPTADLSPTVPTKLAASLASQRFVISVEMDPPRGVGTHKLIAGAHLLASAGADVINVADSPMARMRMSAWAACHLIQREVGIETVLHFPTRGRNLLRVQGDLLAAYALGIRNLFVVLGDPTAIGDYPTAMDNYDVLPSGLIRLIKQGFNVGVDHGGASIGQPTSFLAGCAVNLCAPDLGKEIRSLRKKIAAGADFALTQPVYEIDSARRFLATYAEQHGALTLPILVGVLPLYNARHAAFLHNEVPGISIPETLRKRMTDGGASEGIRIACELLAELRTLTQGAYLMPPFGRYEMAAEIIDGLRPR